MIDPGTVAALTVGAALLGGVVSGIIKGIFDTKNNNRTTNSADVTALLHGQQSIIDSQKDSSSRFQELLEKWVEVTTEKAELAASLRTISGELHDLKDDFARLQSAFDELKGQYLTVKTEAAKVPGLECEVLTLKRRLGDKDETIRGLDVENNALGIGQAVLEGALKQATTPPGTVVIKQTIHKQKQD